MSLAAEHERVDIRALARDTGEHPLFNIVVNYRKFSKTEHGLSAPSSRFQTLTSRDLWDFDIVVGVEEIDDDLVIVCNGMKGVCSEIRRSVGLVPCMLLSIAS